MKPLFLLEFIVGTETKNIIRFTHKHKRDREILPKQSDVFPAQKK